MITFHTKGIDFTLTNQKSIIVWLNDIIAEHKFVTDEISFIFSSDDYLLKVNKQYLNHDYYTDVITFNYNKKKLISGDIFISIDRVKENATKYNETFDNELLRVIVHGVLHLLGYDDKTELEKKDMRKLESYYLKIFNIN